MEFRQQRKPFTSFFQPPGLGMLNKNDGVGRLRKLVDQRDTLLALMTRGFKYPVLHINHHDHTLFRHTVLRKIE